MRRLTRLRQTASVLSNAAGAPLQRPALCRAPAGVLPRHLSATPAARETASGLDKWRRRLWKDEPAGAEDPYSGSAGPGGKEALRQPAELRELELEAAQEQHALEERLDVETDLTLPASLTTAARPEEINDARYVPAESADGLEEVGDLAGWWEDDSHWSSSKEFVGFGPRERVQDASVLEVLARRAVIEALAVREAEPALLTGLWERGSRDGLARVLGLGVAVTDGSARLSADASAVVQSLRWEPTEEAAQEAAVPELAADEARELLKSWDQSWKDISLEDVQLKFAVTKRILQLTGHVIPDSKLPAIHTVKGLLAVLVRPPKPKKLVEEIQAQGTLVDLPNVTVSPRRITPIDKDKMVGRWKVIVRELEKRELPVTGTEGYSKHKEKEYFRGKA